MSQTLVGIDFSGAQDAHQKIWITEATLENPAAGRAQLLLKSVSSLQEERRINVNNLEHSISELVHYLSALQPGTLVGIDAPFSMHEKYLRTESNIVLSWESWIQNTYQSLNHKHAREFKSWCQQQQQQPKWKEKRVTRTVKHKVYAELKRECEHFAQVPFTPSNVRLMYQTFAMLKYLLPNLLAKKEIFNIIPFQSYALRADRVNVVEVCPATWLKAHDIDGNGYKTPIKTPTHAKVESARKKRDEILEDLHKNSQMIPFDFNVVCHTQVLSQPGGDALDSFIACLILADYSEHQHCSNLVEQACRFWSAQQQRVPEDTLQAKLKTEGFVFGVPFHKSLTQPEQEAALSPKCSRMLVPSGER